MVRNVNNGGRTLALVRRAHSSSPVVPYLQKLMREFREKTHLTQRVIGTKAGVSGATINNVLQGKKLDTDTIHKLAKLFGLSDGELYQKAQQWWSSERGADAPAELGEDDLYPTRPPTLDWARKVGYAPSVIRQVAGLKRRDGTDPGGPTWVKLLDAFQAQFDSGIELGRPLGAADEEATAPALPQKRTERR